MHVPRSAFGLRTPPARSFSSPKRMPISMCVTRLCIGSKKLARHDPGIIWTRRDPLLRSVVADARYEALLKELKLFE
jgi:hypothetical protein